MHCEVILIVWNFAAFPHFLSTFCLVTKPELLKRIDLLTKYIHAILTYIGALKVLERANRKRSSGDLIVQEEGMHINSHLVCNFYKFSLISFNVFSITKGLVSQTS